MGAFCLQNACLHLMCQHVCHQTSCWRSACLAPIHPACHLSLAFVLRALQMMAIGLSGAPVLSADGHVIANLSISDLRCVGIAKCAVSMQLDGCHKTVVVVIK